MSGIALLRGNFLPGGQGFGWPCPLRYGVDPCPDLHLGEWVAEVARRGFEAPSREELRGSPRVVWVDRREGEDDGALLLRATQVATILNRAHEDGNGGCPACRAALAALFDLAKKPLSWRLGWEGL